MASSDTLIELRHINKRFVLPGGTEVPVLRDVSLTIRRGEMVAVLGPSGSGKSTLMNLLGGLDVPTSGEYRFDGASVGSLDANSLAEFRSTKVSFIFQSFHLLPGKTVFQNVMLPLLYQRSFHGDMRAQSADALRHAQLEESQWHKQPALLSGGQRQRAAIARALVARPELLLADEPTGNLDSKTGINVIEELRALNTAFGTTVIIVTHDEKIARMVDRIITISDGVVTA